MKKRFFVNRPGAVKRRRKRKLPRGVTRNSKGRFVKRKARTRTRTTTKRRRHPMARTRRARSRSGRFVKRRRAHTSSPKRRRRRTRARVSNPRRRRRTRSRAVARRSHRRRYRRNPSSAPQARGLKGALNRGMRALVDGGFVGGGVIAQNLAVRYIPTLPLPGIAGSIAKDLVALGVGVFLSGMVLSTERQRLFLAGQAFALEARYIRQFAPPVVATALGEYDPVSFGTYVGGRRPALAPGNKVPNPGMGLYVPEADMGTMIHT